MEDDEVHILLGVSRPFLKVKEVAGRLRVQPDTVWRLIRKGDLPAHRIGPRNLRIKASDLETYINDNLVKTDKESL